MNNKTFHIQPWNPAVTTVANSLISKIHEITPDLEVLFMGAAALGLPGKNDIDIDILCTTQDIHKYTRELIAVLGKPKESTDQITIWEFMLDGFEIDCILSDPVFSHVPLQRKRFEILQSNPSILNQYTDLKESCDGMLYSDYEKRKLAFLEEKVLSSATQ
jgi:GrpB-like predicted nucleotidyltransferase (UPF0157 family)